MYYLYHSRAQVQDNAMAAIAYVTLKEGPSLLTNIVDCDPEKLRIGQTVKVAWTPTDGAPLPFFTPI